MSLQEQGKITVNPANGLQGWRAQMHPLAKMMFDWLLVVQLEFRGFPNYEMATCQAFPTQKNPIL